jgi:hypothetical protein
MQVSKFWITQQSGNHITNRGASVGLYDFWFLFGKALLHTVEQLVAPAQKKAAHIASERGGYREMLSIFADRALVCESQLRGGGGVYGVSANEFMLGTSSDIFSFCTKFAGRANFLLQCGGLYM